MTSDNNPVTGTESSSATSNPAVLTEIVTIVTFGLAIITIPNSGAGCRENCVEYPYVNTLSEFPRDYLWMPPAMILVVVYVILIVSIHAYAAQHKKIFSVVPAQLLNPAISFVLENARCPMYPRVAQSDWWPQRGRLSEPTLEEHPQAL
jgi:hypothetical protein